MTGPLLLSIAVFRSSPGRCPSTLTEVGCVRPSVRPCTYVLPSVHKKSFSDFDLIWCVTRPRPRMRTSMTSTRSKVKVNVTELLKFRKSHFSRCISSTIFVWSSKLMVGYDSMGLVYSLSEPDFAFSFQESYHVSSNFVECRYFTKFKWPYFRAA